VRLTAPLARYWWARGLLREMLVAAERTAALPSAAALPADAAALLLWARGAMGIALGRLEQAGPLLERLVDQARRLGDDVLLGHGLTALAMTRPPGPALRPDLAEAVEHFRRAGDTWAVAYALLPLGHVALLEGDVATARARHLEALAAVEAVDDDHLRAQVLDQLGVDAVLVGDADEARTRLAAAAALHRQLSDAEGLANCLDALAALALLLGDAAQAARLCGAATRVREDVGLAVWPLVAPLHRQLSDAVRAVLGEQVDVRERAAGAALPRLDALDEGLRAVGA
jgi:tetratricopeptide (TPR) repeat protein